MVTERRLQVLRAIVQDYVATREPVGSKTIVERHPFGVSAATIRNDMALLEDEELIVGPAHVRPAACRPTKGYRVFVDHLAEIRPLSSPAHRPSRRSSADSSDLDDAPDAHGAGALPSSPARSRSCSTRRSRGPRVTHVELVALGANRLLRSSSSPTSAQCRSACARRRRRPGARRMSPCSRARLSTADQRARPGARGHRAHRRAGASSPDALGRPHRGGAARPWRAPSPREPEEFRQDQPRDGRHGEPRPHASTTSAAASTPRPRGHRGAGGPAAGSWARWSPTSRRSAARIGRENAAFRTGQRHPCSPAGYAMPRVAGRPASALLGPARAWTTPTNLAGGPCRRALPLPACSARTSSAAERAHPAIRGIRRDEQEGEPSG